MADFTEDDLRTMIRDAIARRSGPPSAIAHENPDCGAHASHARFAVSRGGDADGLCIIEPTVRCTHCGFCQSYGH